MLPQLTIFLSPEGTLSAEAPGLNGLRLKLDINGEVFRRNFPDLAEALDSQASRTRAASEAALRARQARNIQYVAEHHSEDLAKRVWNRDSAALAAASFSQALKRLHNTDARSSKPDARSSINSKPQSQSVASHLSIDDIFGKSSQL